MKRWTCHDIQVLIQMHISGEKWPLGETEAWRGSISKLYQNGLIDRADGLGVPTEKGQALIQLWCEQPAPIARYIDPRFEGQGA